MIIDQYRRLKYLGVDVDREKREKYLLEHGAVVRAKRHLTTEMPEGLVVFDIETDAIPDLGLRTDRVRRNPELLEKNTMLEVRLIANGAPAIHSIGAFNRDMVHYNDNPKQMCSKDTIDRFIGEQLEPAEVILGFNVINFDLMLLHRYTDIGKLVMKTVDLQEEAQRFLGKLAYVRDEQVLISQHWLMVSNTGKKLERFDPTREYSLGEEMDKCQQDIRATMELYRLYLRGELCLEKNWKKVTVTEELPYE